jgi:hypothetical protein
MLNLLVVFCFVLKPVHELIIMYITNSEMILGWSPFKSCVWHFRPPTKMAATVQLRCY